MKHAAIAFFTALALGSVLRLPALADATPTPAATPLQDPCGSITSIVTRPTVSTSVCTVRDGHVVVETGYTNTITTGAGGGANVNYPQANIRVGVGRHMEISFAPPSYNRSSVGGSIAGGSNDMNFGAKWELGYSSKASWGTNLVVSAPTGDPAFTAGGTQYALNGNWQYTLSSEFSAGGTIGINSLSATNAAGAFQRYGAFVPSLWLSANLPGSSNVFAEYAFFSHAGPGLGGKSIVDVGYVKDFGDHIQFDIEYGFQPTVINGQKQHYVGAGISFMN